MWVEAALPKNGRKRASTACFFKARVQSRKQEHRSSVCQTHIFMFSSSVASSLQIYMFPRRLEVGNREENSIGKISYRVTADECLLIPNSKESDHVAYYQNPVNTPSIQSNISLLEISVRAKIYSNNCLLLLFAAAVLLAVVRCAATKTVAVYSTYTRSRTNYLGYVLWCAVVVLYMSVWLVVVSKYMMPCGLSIWSAMSTTNSTMYDTSMISLCACMSSFICDQNKRVRVT